MKIEPIKKPRCEVLSLESGRVCQHEADHIITYDDGQRTLMCDIHACEKFGVNAVLYGGDEE